MFKKILGLVAIVVLMAGCSSPSSRHFPGMWPKMMQRPAWNMSEKVGHTRLVYVEPIKVKWDQELADPDSDDATVKVLTEHLIQALREHGVRSTNNPDHEEIRYTAKCYSEYLDIITSHQYPYDKFYKSNLRCTVYEGKRRLNTFAEDAQHDGHMLSKEETNILGIGDTDYYILLNRTILPTWQNMAARIRIAID